MKIAVVRNRKNERVINRFGRPCPEIYGRKSVQRVLDALRAAGHEAKAVEGDGALVSRLANYIPSDIDGKPTGLVFNMAYGIQGDCRYTHVPAMLEMAGVPYTGSAPMGHALCLDKVLTKILMRREGVPTPDWMIADRPHCDPGALTFPLIVKPRHESTSFGLRIVHDGQALKDAIENILDTYRQSALVETYIDGQEVNIGLLGNDPVEAMPPVELDFGGRTLKLDTWDDKYHKRDDEPQKRCPARVTPVLDRQLKRIAAETFRLTHCRDYARVDIRIDQAGRPFVLEINSMASLGLGGSYVHAASRLGMDFEALVGRIVDVAHRRYFGRAAPREYSPATATDAAA